MIAVWDTQGIMQQISDLTVTNPAMPSAHTSLMSTVVLCAVVLSSVESVAGFRCWCENIIGCGKKTEVWCGQSGEIGRSRSCIKIIRDGGDIIRACGGPSMPDLCLHSKLTETTACSCGTDGCNQAMHRRISLLQCSAIGIMSVFLNAIA